MSQLKLSFLSSIQTQKTNSIFPIEYVVDPSHLLQDNIEVNRDNYIS